MRINIRCTTHAYIYSIRSIDNVELYLSNGTLGVFKTIIDCMLHEAVCHLGEYIKDFNGVGGLMWMKYLCLRERMTYLGVTAQIGKYLLESIS